jgi:hypothetical protein
MRCGSTRKGSVAAVSSHESREQGQETPGAADLFLAATVLSCLRLQTLYVMLPSHLLLTCAEKYCRAPVALWDQRSKPHRFVNLCG